MLLLFVCCEELKIFCSEVTANKCNIATYDLYNDFCYYYCVSWFDRTARPVPATSAKVIHNCCDLAWIQIIQTQ